MKPVIHVASLSQSPVTSGFAYRQDPPADWGDGTHTHTLPTPGISPPGSAPRRFLRR